MPYVTVHVLLAKDTFKQKQTLKFRFELNARREGSEKPGCESTSRKSSWQMVIVQTKKSTVRQVVSSDHFYNCEEGFAETVRKLVANMVPDNNQFKDIQEKKGDKRMRDEFTHQLAEARKEA